MQRALSDLALWAVLCSSSTGRRTSLPYWECLGLIRLMRSVTCYLSPSLIPLTHDGALSAMNPNPSCHNEASSGQKNFRWANTTSTSQHYLISVKRMVLY